MTTFNFEKLEVYQLGLHITMKAYYFTKSWPKDELFGLTSQLRRAVVSMPLNIAEGSSRSKKDFRHFLDIARGSCYEVITIFRIARNLNYVTENEFNDYYSEVNRIVIMINALKNSIK